MGAVNPIDLEQLRRFLDEQVALLNQEPVVRCENRRGLREQTGFLLESAFLDMATRLAPDLSVEVGAHEASFSTRLKARLPNIHALAFEANPYVHEHFAAELLKPEIGIDYRFSAISDHDGFSELSIPVKNGDISIGRISRIGGLRRWAHVEFEYENVVVPTLTMDTALGSSVNARSVAWIDAEGSQGEILAGGRDFFRYVTAVYIEVEDLERWSGQSLNSEIAERLAGFSLVPVMRDNLARGQFNEIYIRAETTIISAVVPSIVDYLEALRWLVTAAR